VKAFRLPNASPFLSLKRHLLHGRLALRSRKWCQSAYTVELSTRPQTASSHKEAVVRPTRGGCLNHQEWKEKSCRLGPVEKCLFLRVQEMPRLPFGCQVIRSTSRRLSNRPTRKIRSCRLSADEETRNRPKSQCKARPELGTMKTILHSSEVIKNTSCQASSRGALNYKKRGPLENAMQDSWFRACTFERRSLFPA
jgi:hypothetical protein